MIFSSSKLFECLCDFCLKLNFWYRAAKIIKLLWKKEEAEGEINLFWSILGQEVSGTCTITHPPGMHTCTYNELGPFVVDLCVYVWCCLCLVWTPWVTGSSTSNWDTTSGVTSHWPELGENKPFLKFCYERVHFEIYFGKWKYWHFNFCSPRMKNEDFINWPKREENLNTPIAFDERVTFWLQHAGSLPCACVFAALYACAIA